MSFCKKLESVQYKAVLAITGAIQGTSHNKIYEELEIETLKARGWYRRLSCMFKIMKEEAPNYLINLIPKCNQTIRTRNSHIPIFHCRTDCFKYSFFYSTLKDWFNLDDNIRNFESISVFKTRLPSLICPVQNMFNIFDPKGLKLLARLRLCFSHLNEHRFQHNFENCINPLCSCSLETDFSQHRFDLMNSVKCVLGNFEYLSDNDEKGILLYGDSRLDNNKNKFILEATLSYIKDSERFSGSLCE